MCKPTTVVFVADFVECSVCLEPMHTPVTLPCGHTFCETCVNQLIKTKAIVCPQCRHKAKVPPGGLRKNIVLQQLIETELKRRNTVAPPAAATTTTSSVVEDEVDNKCVILSIFVLVPQICESFAQIGLLGLQTASGRCGPCVLHSVSRVWRRRRVVVPSNGCVHEMLYAQTQCAFIAAVQLNATADEFAREMRREVNAAKVSKEWACFAAHGNHKSQSLGDNVLWMSMDGCDSVGFRTACTLLDKAIADTHTVVQPAAVSASAERAAVFKRFLEDIERRIQEWNGRRED
ncbi:unnamed protein product [Sphagnum balticum]